MKKLLFYVALASLTLTTSCSQDDLVSHRTSENEIQFHASMGMKSRASETTTQNLNTFYVTAFQSDEKNYMQDVDYTKSTNNDETKWTHSGTDTYYWPTSGGLNFYAYAPKTPGKAGTLSIGSDAQTLTGFQPKTAAKDQQDFIYATTTGSKENNAQSGIDLTFNHALSQISVQAKNGNGAYTVTVTGVKIGGVKDQGTFTFPSTTTENSTAAWSDCSTTTGGGSYETTWTTAATLNGTAAQMNDDNVSFMLIPQTLSKNTKYSAGSYIALKATIQMQGGEKLVDDDWIYVGIGDTWAMGKHYTYTLDFTNGAGQDSEGNQIISGKEIAVDVDVTEWNNSEKYVVNPDISTTPTEANCLIMNSPGKVYAINIASKPNAFWTSTAAGTDKMETAPITDDTEWTAEVIWQDITNYEWETGEEPSKPDGYTHKRAIDFYDLTDGAKTSVDTYSGKGKTLYIQLRNTYRGNIVVGVKKKDAQDSDGYLWSWHLWLTEDPLCIGGFMDRNLGATGGLMTTASHPNTTFGLFYQFGRKDPLARDIHYFDINGDLIEKWEETTDNSGNTVRPYVLSGPKSFADVVKNPLQLCATKAKGEWTTSADYVANQWYDINGTTSGSTTKTIFDPSPDGWRLPTKSEIYTVITNGAVGSCIWNNNYTLKGWVYNGNWFAASGYLQCQASENETFHNEEKSGFVWSSEPVPNGEGEDRKAYGIYFNITNGESAQTSTNRGDAASVRCVPE